jgi:hypothetical protein
VLPYADELTKYGIVLIRDGGRLRVIVPPVPGWRHLRRGYFIGAAILVALMLLYVAGAIAQREPAMVAFMIGIWGTPLLILLMFALYRLYRRAIFDVNEHDVIVTMLTPLLSPTSRTFTRAELGEIAYNSSNGKVLFRVPGKDLVEYYVGSDERVARWLSETLNRHLQAVPAAVGDSRDRSQPEILGRPPARPRRGILLSIAGLLGVAGIVCLLLGFPYAVLGIYLILFCCVSVGMEFGTQEKEYYFL